MDCSQRLLEGLFGHFPKTRSPAGLNRKRVQRALRSLPPGARLTGSERGIAVESKTSSIYLIRWSGKIEKHTSFVVEYRSLSERPQTAKEAKRLPCPVACRAKKEKSKTRGKTKIKTRTKSAPASGWYPNAPPINEGGPSTPRLVAPAEWFLRNSKRADRRPGQPEDFEAGDMALHMYD